MVQTTPLVAQFVLVLAVLAGGLWPGAWLPAPALGLRDALRRSQLNDSDYDRMERGYYERLLDAGRRLDLAAELAPGQRAFAHAEALPFDAGPLTLTVQDLREFVLKPNLAIVRRGVTWSTNRQGMRDRDYALAKPPHTFRIALVGDSIGAGWGVDDGRGFEPLVEQWLDQRARASSGMSVEILNFAVPGHAPGQRCDHFQRTGWEFAPDLVVYEATLADPGWDERRLRGLLPRGLGWDLPLYHDVLASAGVARGLDFEGYRRALKPLRWELLEGVYKTLAADCRSHGVPCIWVLIPRVGKTSEPAAHAQLLNLARGAGYAGLADFSDVFDGLDPTALAIGPRDYHPNAHGHVLLARRLEALLVARPELKPLWQRPAAALRGGAP